MLTASRQLWERFADKARRRAFARNHVGNFLASQIFRLRNDRELSQSKLAALIGSTQPQVSEWEGSCENVSLRTLYKLADVFDVAVSVKFVPYSELVREALIIPADRCVPSFESESPEAVAFKGATISYEANKRPRAPRNGAGRGEAYTKRRFADAGTEVVAVREAAIAQ